MTALPHPDAPGTPLRCAHCRLLYEASRAAICDCVSEHRTMRCPHCGLCSCSGRSVDVRRHFATAPAGVLQRRRAALGAVSRPASVPDRLPRPLIVVADDNYDLRAVMKRALERCGFGVVAAEDGARAWEAIQRLHPDVAVLDALMPKIDGREVSRRVKADAKLRTKIVLVTSLYTSAAQKAEAYKTFGVDAHLAKPVRSERLAETVSQLLAEKE